MYNIILQVHIFDYNLIIINYSQNIRVIKFSTNSQSVYEMIICLFTEDSHCAFNVKF